MILPRPLASTLFSALALAAIAAGCSAGGGGSIPTAPGTPSNAPGHRRASVGAVLRIHIPRRHKHHGRGAAYVSPNMLALTVAVQHVTASPWPSLPLQTLVVGTPHPCSPAGGGLTCIFNVKAFIGKNVFAFNEYATKHPTPQDTPLGTLATGVETIASGGSGLDFVLEGVVNRVQLSVPNPESTYDPASKNTEPIPIGTAAAFPLFVNPEDASGASIATDAFSSPITIAVSPPNSGVSLALAAHCAGDTTTPTTVTLNCASDLNGVTIAYDGSVTQTGANSYVDGATVAASPQHSEPAPQPVNVALTSNLLAYQLVAPPGGTNPYINSSNVALDPVSGKMVFAYTTRGLNPTFLAFDPANPTAAPLTHSIPFNPGFVIFDAAGNLWTNDETSPALHCFTSISAAGATIGVSDALGAVNDAVIAPDASGNIWFAGVDVSWDPSMGFFPASCTAASHRAQFLINHWNEEPAGIALAQPAGGNAAVGMVTGYGGYDFYTANTATAASPTPAAAWPAGEYPGGLVNDKSYNMYGASYGIPVVNKIAAGTANISTFAMLPRGSRPAGIDQYSGTQTTAQALAVLDDVFTGAALINPASTLTEPLEIVAGESYACMGVAYDKNGAPWVVCYHGDGSIWAYRPVVTSTWSALPSAFQYTGSYQTAITVAETSGIDNSPFTVTSNSNPSVIAIGTPWPGTPAFPHAIPVQIGSTGTAVLTISDKHGRTQTLSVAVSPSGVVSARHHNKRRAPRPK